MTPFRAWKKGERRSTPKETPLDGTYRETYWCAHLTEEETDSEVWSLEDFLSRTLDRLALHAPFLGQLLAEDGRAELFVGFYVSRNSGFELSRELTRDLSKLGISLAFDIYP